MAIVARRSRSCCNGRCYFIGVSTAPENQYASVPYGTMLQ
jgi:hypothetical protein